MSSRLQCRCNRCDHVGDRSTFYKSRPNNIPTFDDVCPICQSNNIDVIDTVARAASNRAIGSSNWKGQRDEAAA